MAAMNERPPPPPEARLIAAALKRSGLSIREASRRADLSEGRWRQIMNGYQTVSAGVHIPVSGPPDTVARMARVAGVRVDELGNAGRPDAAMMLQDMSARPEGEGELGDDFDARIEAIRRDPVKRRRLLKLLGLLEDDEGDGR